MDVHAGDMTLRESRGDEPALYLGPRGTALYMGWHDYTEVTSCTCGYET